MNSYLRHLILLVLQLSLREVVSLCGIINSVSVLLQSVHHVDDAGRCLVAVCWPLLFHDKSRTRHKLLYALSLHILYSCVHKIIILLFILVLFLLIFKMKVNLVTAATSSVGALMSVDSEQTVIIL